MSHLHYIKEFKMDFVEFRGVPIAGIVYSGLNTFPLYIGEFHQSADRGGGSGDGEEIKIVHI
jgi:hypothetical protein